MNGPGNSDGRRHTSEGIRQRMQEVRGHLDEDVGELLAKARIVLDWRRHVRNHAWLAVAVAAVSGFLIVPKRRKVVCVDAQALAELAQRDRLVLQLERKPAGNWGVAGALMAPALAAASRGATNWISNQVGQLLQKRAAKSRREGESSSAITEDT